MRFSAVVLAAGSSTRMAGKHKLLLPLGDEPVIRRTVRAVLAAGPLETVAVTGSQAQAVQAALAGLPVRFAFNARHGEGQATSVAAGVAALSRPCDAIMICLGDMAALEPADYRGLAEAHAARPHGSITVPRRDGMRGNPVVFSGKIADGLNLGCRRLIADNPDEVYAYAPPHDRFFVDLDTPQDYGRLLERLALPPATGVS